MNLAAPQTRALTVAYRAYIVLFFLYLAAPLIAAGVFAFNDSQFPSLPWNGFTLNWFFGTADPMIGLFHDRRLLEGIQNSVMIGLMVAALSVVVGTTNAFLFERRQFPGKEFFYILMVIPLVIPGVILGISILVFAGMIANTVENAFSSVDMSILRPGIFLVVMGQFSFLVTITSLVIGARLRKFDLTMEEAAFNLGASRARVLATVTLPFLRPALIASFVVAFLVSFENFNTTVMLVGSQAPLTVVMFDRIVKQGSTPVLNAVSVVLMLGSGLLVLYSIFAQREREPRPEEGA